MTSPRDEIDNWLARDVTPLSPPPGSLDRIRRRARQRKTRQATVAAAGCAVVLAAAVVTPQLIAPKSEVGEHKPPPVAVEPSTPAMQASVSPSSDTASPLGKATQIQQLTTLGKSWTQPPGHFQPTSVTFVGTGTGGVVGAVIGQAGPPCASQYCTSLAGTSDYGQHWYGVSAPYASGPTGDAGASQLRFANLSDGWAYGPALYETSNGGSPWRQEKTHGQRVIDIEAAPASGVQPARGYAVFGTCTGSGPSYSTDCTSYSLWTSVAGSRTWTAVSVPAGYRQLTATSSAAASSAAPLLVIAGGTTGYLVTSAGKVLSGPTDGSSWREVGQAPCTPSSSSPNGQSAGNQASGAQLAAGKGLLLLACVSSPASGTYQVTLQTSASGSQWHQAGSFSSSGRPTGLTSAAAGQAVVATTSGIEYSANGGGSWQAATFKGASTAGPKGGFSYVGMTNAQQGVAVPVNSGLGEIYVTRDGGVSWSAAPISG